MKIAVQFLFLLTALVATYHNSFYSFLIVYAAMFGMFVCDRLVKTTTSPIRLIRYYQLAMALTLIVSIAFVCAHGSQ